MSAVTESPRNWLPAESTPGQKPGTTTRRAWKIGRLLGVDLYVHPTFLLLLAWVAMGHSAGGVAAMLRSLAFVIAIFGVVVLHELGHALVARQFGIRTRDITLLPIGGVASLERVPEKPIEELLVAVAGPAVNVVLALFLFAVLQLTGQSVSPTALGSGSGSFLTELMWVNVSLAAFNLLPAFPMDGGRLLRAGLALKIDRDRATAIAARIGQAMAAVFGVLGLFFDPMLLIIALFVWVSARQEFIAVGVKRALSGVTIGSAMRTEFRVLSPVDRLSTAAALLITSFQRDFPVVDGRRLVGVLTRSDIARSISSGGAEESVASAMQREFVTAHAADMLETAHLQLRAPDATPIVVVHDGDVVGVVSAENISEFIQMQGIRGARRG